MRQINDDDDDDENFKCLPCSVKQLFLLEAGTSVNTSGQFWLIVFKSFLGFFSVVPFLTRTRHVQHELSWVVGKRVARWAVNFMQMRYARGLLLNCCQSLIKMSRSTSSHWMRNLYGLYRNGSRWSTVLWYGKCAYSERNDINTEHYFLYR